jgi:hypothetical protein
VPPPLLTDRRELVDSRFCKLGVDCRRSSLKDVVLGVLRGVVPGWIVLDEEIWRSWVWLCWDGDLDGERGEKTGGPKVVASERRLR